MCKRKPAGYWTEAKLIEEAKPFKSRNEFRKHNESAYRTAQNRGLLYVVCAHMKTQRTDWTIEMLFEAAKPFKTRTAFMKGNSKAYSTAQRRGLLYFVCVHMERVGNKLNRFIYAVLNVRLNKAYIGLTFNHTRRTNQHVKGNEAGTAQLIKEDDSEFIKLTDYINADAAGN